MKVTLISPYSDLQAFGIRTLSACLKQEGHGVQLIFLPRDFTDKFEETVLNEVVELSRGSGLIGISLMTNFFNNVVQITQRLKEKLRAPILWGGVHPTIRPEECLDYADMVCLGEGEETLVELAGKMKDGLYCHDVQGMWFKDQGRIIANKMRPLIRDLDSIPFPDYDYETHYILKDNCIQKMDEHLLKAHMNGIYVTIPSRGCPFGCTYCCNNTLNKMYSNAKIVRKRNVDNIIKELMEVKSRLPFIKCIIFGDDAFFIRTVEEIREFCKKYRDNVGLPLSIGGATPSTIIREKLSLLVDAGLIFLRMGIQTGSERTKKLYKRYHSNTQVEEAVKIINEFKDKIRIPHYDIIIDNPWETDEDLIETLMFLAKLPTPYQLTLYSLVFYPGTELYEMAKRDGIITGCLKDIYRQYYHDCKATYLNSLFFLLHEYASRGDKISTKMMFLLTNRKLSQLKLNRLLYYILKTQNLLYKGFKAIQKGDWARIIRYIRGSSGIAVHNYNHGTD
ncbi:MAG: B12-binding domain-containing radical SAM protein [Elusimicrobia bacterium]|nr:B12-binding domain-containing radical SAM protein [Elusimicrobiota bacterium]